MPIIRVKILKDNPQDTLHNSLVQDLADQLGVLFVSDKGQTWVQVECQPQAHYAENGSAEAGVYPTFVEVLKAKLRSPDELAAEAEQIATIVASVLNAPRENTHVHYLPESRGRIAFGGKLLPD